MATYFDDTEGNENLSTEQIVDAVNSAYGRGAKSPNEPQGETRRRALANSGYVEDADGNLRHENGQMAGPAPKPNVPMSADGPSIPESERKQREMDAASKRLEERLKANNPNHFSGSTLLTNWAIAHNAKLARPEDKTNVGPRVTIVGGGHKSAMERRRDFIERNPNAVSPQEREAVLGSGNTTSWDVAAKQQQQAKFDEEMARRQKEDADIKARASEKEMNMAQRQTAFGSVARHALGGLWDMVADGKLKDAQADGKTIVEKEDSDHTKHKFARFRVDGDSVNEVNARRRALGVNGDYSSVFAEVEIGSNGRPIEGTAKVYASFTKDGQSSGGTTTKLRDFDVPYMERVLRKAYTILGHGENADALVYSDMGGFGLKPQSQTNGRQAGDGNWHVEVAKTNAEARKYAADKAAESRVQSATIGANGKVEVAKTNAQAMLEKTDRQIKSYAAKNLTQERIAAADNEAKKYVAELKSNTSLKISDLEAKSKERISAASIEAQKAIADGKSEDWLMGKQLEYDAKIKAIEATKMSQEAKNKLTQQLAAEKNAITLKVAEMRQATEEDKLDLGWAKEGNDQANAEVAQDQRQQEIDETATHHAVTEEQGQQKIDDDKEWRKEEILLKKDAAKYSAIAKRTGNQDALKIIRNIQDTLAGGGLTAENREALRTVMNDVAKMVGEAGKAPVKTSDNSSHEPTLEELEAEKARRRKSAGK